MADSSGYDDDHTPFLSNAKMPSTRGSMIKGRVHRTHNFDAVHRLGDDEDQTEFQNIPSVASRRAVKR